MKIKNFVQDVDCSRVALKICCVHIDYAQQSHAAKL